MFQNYFKAAFYSILFILISAKTYSQVSISGPTCGVAGSTASYTAVRSGGNFNGVDNMQWCISGGIILQAYGTNVTGNSTCKTGTAVGLVVVQWNNVSSGSLTLNTPVGNAPTFIVTVVSALSGGTISNTSQTIGYYTTPATINCSVASGGYCGTANYQYQWQKSLDNSSWTNISGATSQNLSFSSPLIQTTYYRRQVLETNTSTYAYSSSATVFVNPPFTTLNISPASQDLFSDGTTSPLSLTAPATGGSCSGNYSYFWQTSTDGGNTYSDNGTNGNVPFNPPVITGTRYYRMKVTCGTETAFSNAVVVNVYDHLATPPITPSSLTISYNTSPSFSVGAPTGGICSGSYNYLWEKSYDNVNFTTVGTSMGYMPGNLTTTTYFRRTVTCGAESVSSTVLVNVNSELVPGILAPGNIVIPSNTSPGNLTSTPAKGGVCGSYTYTWQNSTNGSTYQDIAGASAMVYNAPNLTVNTYYRVKITCGIDIAFTSPLLVTIKTGAYTYNYVQVRDITKPLITTETSAAALTALRDIKQSTQYFDGLGRPLQTIVKQGSLITDPLNPLSSANAVDLVTQSVYDDFGRETYKYLSFAATATDATKNDGNFKLNPFQQVATFYNDTYNNNPLKGQGENYFYSQSDIEYSPLNRPEKAMAPGNSWVGSSRSIETKYLVNTTTDAVRIWTVNIGATGSFSTYSVPTTPVYAAGSLIKTIIIDEHGKQVIEFKDKEGKIILKKVQLTATADDGITGSGYGGWLCTYYIYDVLNNLRLVVQPRGVELSQPTWELTNATILAEQCFRYEYDARNRMIVKKVPGATEVYMVYDARDRLVMTQDAVLRASSKWMVTLYDDLNRPVQTGLLLNTYTTPNPAKTFVQHLTDASISTAYPFAVATPPTTTYWEYLTKTGYDDYTTIPAASGLTSALDNTYINGTYGFFTTYNTSPEYAQQIPSTPSAQTRGMVTWAETKVLNGNTYLYNVTLYDEKGRPVQVKSKNITGGKDLLTTQYSWSGQPLVVVQKVEKAGAPVQTSIIATKMIYDDLGRLVQTDKKVQNTNVNSNALPASFTTVSKNEYDALGQLKKKTIGNKKDPLTGNYYAIRQPLQELTYDYNIRGWTLGMNRDYLATEGQTSDGKYFGFELGYDKLTNKAGENFNGGQWNGNIGGMVWKSDGDDIRRKYDFGYDEVNRLLKADFKQQNGDDHAWNNSQVNYTVLMGDGATATTAYDANGNIKSMTQYGLKFGANPQIPIDQLTYNYTTNSNKLLNVIDAQNEAATKLGDFRTSLLHPTQSKVATTVDYTYDVNGNLLKDLNKDIGKSSANGIAYYHLNLPRVITLYKADGTAKGTINYVYDAVGNKLRKLTVENASTANNNITTTTTTTYLDGIVYESKTDNNAQTTDYTDRVQFIAHEEGRIRFKPENSMLEYDYMIKDHLGNVRMVLTEELKMDKYPVASLETTKLATEDDYYSIDQARIVDANTVTGLPAYTNDNGIGNNPTDVAFETANSLKLYQLNSGTNKTGLGITLKVMSGDRIDIHGKSYYFQNNTGGSAANSAVPVLEILNGLLGGPSGGVAAGAHGGVTGTQLSGYPGTTGGINTLLSNQTTDNNAAPTVPKAYINYLFFDEQFKCVGSGFSKLGTNGIVKNHFSELQNLTAPKNGYVYIYCSNESPVNVFFDNLQVVHTRGPIIEETHYYPFGLTMQGISSKALAFGNPSNKFKYNGKEEQRKEFSDGSGLEWYDYGARMYDQQIGRWHVQDNYSETYFGLTPYNYGGNNFVNTIDIDGNLFIFANGFMLSHWEGGTNKTKEYRYKADPGVSYTVPNPNYYNPDRGFYEDGPRNNGKKFETDYWEGIDKAYMKYQSDFNDETAYYTNGSFTPQATAGARFNDGLTAGADLIARLESGDITLKDGETIKIIGHSHGAAYAAGIASALSKHSKYGALIEFVDYLSPHQPGDITHPSGVKGHQFSTKSDEVSSKGLIPKLFGKSKYEKIPGTEWGMERDSYEGGRGGHSVGTWLNDLIDYWRSLGITVTVHE